MTYRELREMEDSDVRNRGFNTPQGASISTPERRAWEVIKKLYDRKSFDHWWDQIDPDIQDEIFEELKEACE